jgi:hypothetical protein
VEHLRSRFTFAANEIVPKNLICMAASKDMQLIKAANQTNRLATKTFFALHKRWPHRAAIASNKFQFCRRI